METKDQVVEAIKNRLASKDLTNQAVQVLKQSSDNVINKTQQELLAKIKEDSSDSIQNLSDSVYASIESACQQFSGKNNNAIVLPEGTKFIHKSGLLTTLIIEQAPQVRTLSIGNGKYSIALPYVQFIFCIREDKVDDEVYVVVTKKPLTNLDDVVYQLPLPNVENCKICRGKMTVAASTCVTTNIKNYIGGFWQSEFNADLSVFHTSFMDKNELNCKEWEKQSRANPLFILSKNFSDGSGKNMSLRKFIHKDESTKSAIKNDIVSAIQNICKNIQDTINKTNFQTHNTKNNHTIVLQNILKELIVQAYSELWEYLNKQVTLEKDLMQKRNSKDEAKMKQKLKN